MSHGRTVLGPTPSFVSFFPSSSFSRFAAGGLLGLFALTWPDAARAQEEPFGGAEQLDRSALVRAVLERNPSIDAARHAWGAAAAEVSQEGALPYPTVEYGAAPFSFGPDDRLGQRVQAIQRVPFPGKLGLRRAMARAEAEMAEGDFESTRLEIALAASLLFDDWYEVHRALEINREHQELLDSFKRIATSRFAAGQASMQDPLQAEVELAHLEHRGIVLETERAVVRARINALLHRATRAALPEPPAELAVPPATAAADLIEQALAGRPEIDAADAGVRAGRAGLSLAKRELLPDFMLMGSYNSMWMNPDHQWMAGVGITVPLWPGRVRGVRREAEARLERAKRLRERVEDEVRFDVTEAQERFQEAHHVVRLVRDRVLPAARDQVSAARSGFESGRNSFLALIEAEKNLRSVKLSLERAYADLQRRQAELTRALGRIPAESAPETNPQDKEEGDAP